jgi:hypothetical protein
VKEQPPTLGHALRGLLVWVLCSLIAVGCLVLLYHLMPIFDGDPNRVVIPKGRPLAALAMFVIVLLVVMTVFYVAFVLALLMLKPFVSRAELKAHLIEQLGSGKSLGPFHAWLFARIFRRRDW